MNHMVLFHKTPARWNKQSWLAQHQHEARLGDYLGEQPVTSGVETLVNEDLYIQLCLKLKEHCGIDHIHIVQGYDTSEAKNWFVEEKEGKYTVSESITYWSIGDLNHLLDLPPVSLVFSRGNYPHLHSFLRNHISALRSAYWMHYPATSALFPHLDAFIDHVQGQSTTSVPSRVRQNLVGMWVEHNMGAFNQADDNRFLDNFGVLVERLKSKRHQPIPGPYDAVLVDDEALMDFHQSKHPEAEIVSFHKPCLGSEQLLRHHRKHDLMFCGTTLQATKNHKQFLDLLYSIDQVITSTLDVAIVGNEGSLPAFSEGLRRDFLHVRVTDYGEVSRQRLADLFNDTRNVVVTSGRDSNPRIIQEAGVCGARVLVVDTLSDGLTVLKANPILGAVLMSDKSSWYYQKNGNLIFDVNSKLVNQLLKQMNHSRHPRLTARVAKGLYTFDNVVGGLAERFNLQAKARD
jgi:hypothetical protein